MGVWVWVLAALPLTAIADQASPASSRALLLKTGPVDTRTLDNLASAAPAAFEPGRWYVLQLNRPIDKAIRAELARSGARLGQYLPRYAYLAQLGRADPRRIANLPYVAWIGPYRDEWKLDPIIRSRSEATERHVALRLPAVPDAGASVAPYQTPHRRALAQAGNAQVVVTLLEDTDAQAAVAAIRALPGASLLSVNDTGRHTLLDAVVPVPQLAALAQVPGVQFVSDAPEGTLRNDVTRWVVQSGVSAQTPLWDNGLTGEGQIVGIIDGAFDKNHCSFLDPEPVGPTHRKIVAYRGASGTDDHGTHVAGIAAGDRGTYGTYDYRDGMAFGAKISFTNYLTVYNNPSTLRPRLIDAHNDGARVHSNSWGEDYTTEYTTWCQQIDSFSSDYETDLVVFAATNLGSLQTPENAKNVLAVGATWQYPDHNCHYSGGEGPTSDGRRKPEVYAPGRLIYSSDGNTTCSWRSMSGTSMAAPAVAGMAVLAGQYYTEGYYPTGLSNPGDERVPSGALVKATVVNATVEMTDDPTGYPNDLEGWGRIVMDTALHFDGDDERLFVADVFNSNGLSTGESDVYNVWIADDAQPLRITLVWTDPPATVGAAFPPINDLNLVVTAPDLSTVYYGNWFHSGESAGAGNRDVLNNVERVILNTPDVGNYRIQVEGFEVNEGTQGYAFVTNGGIRSCQSRLSPGDADSDGDVDLTDFADFQKCFGAGDTRAMETDCYVHDIDCDDDVDMSDFDEFEPRLAGPS